MPPVESIGFQSSELRPYFSYFVDLQGKPGDFRTSLVNEFAC